MSKFPTFPTLYDGCNKLTISFLKSRNYLTLGTFKGGTVIWSSGKGEYKKEAGSISIKVCTYSESPYIELDYKCNGELINYRVKLVSIPSNLGKGVVWFFVCPQTGKRCRKLYLISNYFFHRTAFRGCMYEKQTQSKKYKLLGKLFGNDFAIDRVYEQINSKHFKKQYNGKPTKRYLRLQKIINKSEISFNSMEQIKKMLL